MNGLEPALDGGSDVIVEHLVLHLAINHLKILLFFDVCILLVMKYTRRWSRKVKGQRRGAEGRYISLILRCPSFLARGKGNVYISYLETCRHQ